VALSRAARATLLPAPPCGCCHFDRSERSERSGEISLTVAVPELRLLRSVISAPRCRAPVEMTAWCR